MICCLFGANSSSTPMVGWLRRFVDAAFIRHQPIREASVPTHGHFIKLHCEQVSFKKEAGVRVDKMHGYCVEVQKM